MSFGPEPIGGGGGGGSGETNDGVSLGSGEDIYAGKSGVNLQYNTLDSDEFEVASNLISLSNKLDVVGGRLEYVSTTEIKWEFTNNNQIRVYDNGSSKWQLVEMSSEPTLSNSASDMGSTTLTYDKIYDVFLKYSSATAVTIECASWASDSQRDAAWVTSTAYKIGDRVNESSNIYACLEAHTSGTFATDLAAGKWIQVDADGLDTLNGVEIYADSGTFRDYRYVGIIRLEDNTGAKFVETNYKKFIWNKYNKRLTTIECTNDTASYTRANASWAESGYSQVRGEFILGEAKDNAIGNMVRRIKAATGGSYYYACVFDMSSGSPPYNQVTFNTGGEAGAASTFSDLGVGYHYLTTMELMGSGTGTLYGTNYMNVFTEQEM